MEEDWIDDSALFDVFHLEGKEALTFSWHSISFSVCIVGSQENVILLLTN